ncbi:alpha/beta hydrolase [Janibacter sp. G56]|uniref:alpha/beta hydrolase n=1 Tax=Janibacter sp. G56 TaxID=3418717 RepID=UPI003CFDF379
MKAPHPGMSPALTVLTTLLDNGLRGSIVDQDLDGIRRSRAQVFPAVPPFAWVTGALDRRVTTRTTRVPVRDGHEVPVRIHRPRADAGALPVVLWFHGGGWVQGNPTMYDPLCTHLAAEVGAVVVAPDYRKAPEHPAPRPVQDVLDVAAWVVENAVELGVDATRVAVAGDSAGGNLAAVVAQVWRDAGDSPIRHQALIYPATDLTLSSPSLDEHAHAPILTKDAVLAFHRLYLDGHPQDDPLVSPLLGDLVGLPPALVQTADLDPIRDDGIRYARSLEAAGVPTRLTNYVGAPHGFASFPGAYTGGRQHRAELVGELRTHLHPDA